MKNCGKQGFFGTNRCFLPQDDPLRLPSSRFATAETRIFKGRPSGETLKQFVEKLQFPPPGKMHKKSKALDFGVGHNWTNKSLFFELPFW